jgi:four helix bundle protein
MRRSAGSIGANIAEGCSCDTDADFARFLTISLRSASELEYHLLLARDLEMLIDAEYEQLNSDVVEVKKMLIAFVRKLRARTEWPQDQRKKAQC